MEPSPYRPPVVPKLHLLFSDSPSSASRNDEEHESSVTSSSRTSQRVTPIDTQQQQQHSYRMGSVTEQSPLHTKALSSSSYQRPSPRFTHPTPPRHTSSLSSSVADKATTAVVTPNRVSTATVAYLESPKLPPMLQRQLRHESAASLAESSSSSSPHHCSKRSSTADGPTTTSTSNGMDEFRILHPSLDLNDENGELSQLMLSKWSIDAGEDEFAFISLFCEMKFNEAKRMASWVESPNRFFATMCCQLLQKYIDRIEGRHPNGNDLNNGNGNGLGHSAELLRRILGELVNAIFLPFPSHGEASHSTSATSLDNFDSRVPYFTEFRRLRKHNQFLLDAVQNRDKAMTTRERLPEKVDKLLRRTQARNDRHTLSLLFRGWAKAVTTDKEIRSRESVEYQTMLSITAASLSRKDILIAEAESKVTSMAKIIDSLTESNAQLMHRIEQLESSLAGYANGSIPSGGGGGDGVDSTGGGRGNRGADSGGGFNRRHHDVQFEHIDTLIAQDDERMDRINRMLLETMFSMARMVESCAIQMSKDVMDSLEYQLDGSVLQNLAEMIQAENMIKMKTEASQSRSSTPSTSTNGGIADGHSVSDTGGSTSSTARGTNSLSNSRAVRIKDLAHMPIDALLLCWFRMNLQMSSSIEKASDRTIKNFTSDLTDGRRYSFLLHRLFPTWFDSTMVHEIDSDQRLRNVESFHSRIQPELPQVVTSDSIHADSIAENVSFVAMLFGSSVGSIRKVNLERQRGEFLNIITSWKRVRGLLLEVKRMNDNYDALMVVHLMKEMRTCETLFKQLNSELASIAIASNETSSALSQIAYKILGLTWNCLNARSKNQVAALEIIDERWQERIKDFTFVDIATVRELMVAESEIQHQLQSRGRRGSTAGLAMAPVVPERDVQQRIEALRSVVTVYSKDLHDIFKHYSASGGAGSIASMSVAEFNKFVKDCLICDKGLTPQAAEGIYRSTMLHSPLGILDHTPLRDSQSPSSSSSDTLDSDIGSREMVGREFVDALIRIAAVKYSNLNLDDRFHQLIEQTILPNALRSQSEIFRAEVASPKVRAVFQKHKPTLQRIFRYYTSMHMLREQQSTMSLKELAVFAKDCKLIGSFITEHTLKQVLVNLQQDVEPGSEDDLRADFGDFLEAIAALTECVICNPYAPLYKRVEQFINEMLLPRARQKK